MIQDGDKITVLYRSIAFFSDIAPSPDLDVPGRMIPGNVDNNGIFRTRTALIANDITSGNDFIQDLGGVFTNADGLSGDPNSSVSGQPYLASVSASFLYGLNDSTSDFDRIRSGPENADGQTPLTLGSLHAIPRPQLFNGTNYDRQRSASATNLASENSQGATITSPPGMWSVSDAPAANTVANATKAAAGLNIRNIATSISFTFIGGNASTPAIVQVQLLDNVTVLWQLTTGVGVTVNAPYIAQLALSGLAIPGSANTAMSLAFTAAGGVDTIQSVALTGYEAQ